MYIRNTYKLADSWRNEHGSGVRLTTLLAQPVYTKIGRTRAGPADGLRLLQRVGVLGRQCEVVCEDDMFISEKT